MSPMSQPAQAYELKDVQNLLMDKLNATDFRELFILIDCFDMLNKHWIFALILSMFNNNNYTWCVLKSEPEDYISISQEILDILEGNICTYEITDAGPDQKKAWKVCPLRE